MVLVVQVGNGLPQRLDAGRGAVLAAGYGDVERLRPREAALDLVVDLGGALAQIRPQLGLVEETKLGRTLRAPDDARRGTRGIETRMGQVALVGSAKLAMDLAAGLWRVLSQHMLDGRGKNQIKGDGVHTVDTRFPKREAARGFGDTGIPVDAELALTAAGEHDGQGRAKTATER